MVFSTVIKQLLDEIFCDIQNDQARGKGYENPYRDLDYSEYLYEYNYCFWMLKVFVTRLISRTDLTLIYSNAKWFTVLLTEKKSAYEP